MHVFLKKVKKHCNDINHLQGIKKIINDDKYNHCNQYHRPAFKVEVCK